MFSTRQTILAALYKGRLDAEWNAGWNYREEGDIDRVEPSTRSGPSTATR
jgi:hypothetical protein